MLDLQFIVLAQVSIVPIQLGYIVFEVLLFVLFRTNQVENLFQMLCDVVKVMVCLPDWSNEFYRFWKFFPCGHGEKNC